MVWFGPWHLASLLKADLAALYSICPKSALDALASIGSLHDQSKRQGRKNESFPPLAAVWPSLVFVSWKTITNV